jgi:protein TonB
VNNMDANRISSGYELKDELARLCLPAASHDPNRKLAWMNSLCILFLLIGIFGSRLASITIKPVPPMEEIAPVVLEPTPPPQTITANQNENETEQQTPEAPQVVVVTPEAPNINFSVPTIGNLIAPSVLAQAPPLRPMQRITPVSQLARLNNTGSSGDRPQPVYPKLALQQGEQGTVTLLLTADASGNVASAEIKNSSGFPILDRGTLDFIKRRWTLPAGNTNQTFQTSITYQLQAD